MRGDAAESRDGARQLVGPEEVEAALERGDRLLLLLVRRGTSDVRVRAVTERARAAGVWVQETGANDLRRMSRTPQPAELLALAGRDPHADREAVLASPAPVWLLIGIRYPGNAGFAIRTAEVSGAGGVFLDVGFDAAARKQALRASMFANRFLPVFWEAAGRVLERARAAGRRVLAIEDVGEKAPWAHDLTGPVLFVIGGEERGIPPIVLERSDAIVRIPMAGFIPSYNLQAAMAMVAGERLRQVERTSTPDVQ